MAFWLHPSRKNDLVADSNRQQRGCPPVPKRIDMIKNLFFAATVFSLALASGCATGGSGPCAVNCPSISITNTSAGLDNVDEAPVGGATILFTATTSNLSSNTVTWSISPSSCGSACGTITSTGTDTATYTSPSTVPSNSSITIVATSQSDSSISGNSPITIVNVTTSVAPASPKVGQGLAQMFTAIATPDNAPQSFATWTCTNCSGTLAACSASLSVVGSCWTYTPSASDTKVQISAPPSNSTGCGSPSTTYCTAATATVVADRVSGTYGFKFSGYDSSSHQVLAAGTFTVSGSGISGVEDQISWNGTQYAPSTGISVSGSYQASNNDSGTLTLNGNTFNFVLNGAGDIQLAEADANGTFYGVAELASKASVPSGANFAFGLTGVEPAGNRVGYVGLFGTAGSTVSGLLDTDDSSGQTTNICGTSPCSVTANFTFPVSGSTNQGTLTLTSGAWTQSFALFGANGTTNASNPFTLYAISTSTVDATQPALLGEVQLQATPTNKSGVYDNTAFNGTSVSALTGTGGNVSLTLSSASGTSSGAGGTGTLSGQFDENNPNLGGNNNIVSVSTFPSASQTTNPYTYVATNNSTGRYIFYMLGNPGASPVVPPLPFILYASAPNRGFLLECNTSSCSNSDQSVITGTMTPQRSPTGGFFNAGMTGTYAVATNSNSLSGGCNTLMPSCVLEGNLLLTSPGILSGQQAPSFPVNGTENGESITGSSSAYNITLSGTGTLSATVNSNTANYVLYAIDGTDYYLLEEDKGVPSPVLFMSQ